MLKPSSSILGLSAMTSIRINVQTGAKTSEQSLPAGSTVEDLLKKNGLHPDAYIVMIGSKPVPVTRRLVEGESLKLIKVASGG